MIRFVALFLIILGMMGGGAYAQGNNGGPVIQKGTVTATDCAQWAGPGAIQDSGAGCGGGGGGSPGGTNGQIQYNNSGSFGGITPAISTGCQATGGTIGDSLVGTISTQVTPTTLSGSNPAITTGYCGGLENLNNASAQVPTIAEAGSAGFPAGWYTDLCNINTGAQTLTPGAGTVGGASTLVIAAGSAAAPVCYRLVSDGVSNYDIVFPPGPVTASSTTTFTNKTITSSTDTLGGVTAGFGSDAKGDIYTNGGSSNVVTRLGIGSTGQCLLVASALPSWAACPNVVAPFATGSSTGNTVTGPYAYFVCTAACTVTPPVPVAGYQFCVMNSDNVTGAITLGAIGSSARYENTARTAYGTAGTGTLTSGGAAGDMICIIGLDSTHYLSPTYVGTWVAS